MVSARSGPPRERWDRDLAIFLIVVPEKTRLNRNAERQSCFGKCAHKIKREIDSPLIGVAKSGNVYFYAALIYGPYFMQAGCPRPDLRGELE